MRDKKSRVSIHSSRPLRISVYSLLLALACIFINPLSALACGGLFSADNYTEQGAERLIFAVNAGQVTLYEQIHYTGSPKDFAWVLPVPAIPKVDTASISLFQELDQQTAPRFFQNASPSCESGTSGAPAPASVGAVNVYSSGAVGPYNYSVISSNNPQALTLWLTGHNYKIPVASQAEMRPYIAAHMFFLAMRLQGNAGVQDMLPVKITYATSQSAITIPLRMATPMGKENLGVLVWIFAKSRYIPQNYQSLQLNYDLLSNDLYSPSSYPNLVSEAVNKVDGHGFVTEYAQPTSNLNANGTELTALEKSYSYLTRMYTSIAPAQINLDPSFVASSGLPNIEPAHEVANPASSQPLSCPISPLLVGGIVAGGVLVIVLGGILFVVNRRKNTRAS
ncbi:MAG TPA: DUF2330 domain-containing protein [Ktedonobacteraceae bacterium]|nr:DUF2330 domain-containing protein [Ktedonobacteraceae bacterium]